MALIKVIEALIYFTKCSVIFTKFHKDLDQGWETGGLGTACNPLLYSVWPVSNFPMPTVAKNELYIGKTTFSHNTPGARNHLQKELKLYLLASLSKFKRIKKMW